MSKIESVEAIPFAIPLKRPLLWSSHRIDRLEHVLVRVRTRDGVIGIGEAAPRPMIYGESLQSVVHALENWIAPAIQGLDCFDTEKVNDALGNIPGNPSARSSAEMAVYDAMARTIKIPLARLLGGWKDEVEVSYMLGHGPVDDVVQEALQIRSDTGIKVFKLKAGREKARDLALVARLRGELGPDATLYPDFNGQCTLHEAMDTIRRMAEHGILCVEEPLPIGHRTQRMKLAGAISVPLLADDSATTLPDAAREIAEGTAGAVCVKIARTGFRDSLGIVKTAEAFGIPCLIGSQGLSDLGTLFSVHLAAAVRNVSLPSDLGNFIKQQEFITSAPPVVRNGRISVPEGFGSGADVDFDRLQRMAL